MAKAKTGTSAAKAKEANVLTVKGKSDAERNQLMAELSLTPGARHAAIASGYATGLMTGAHELPMPARLGVIGEAMTKARAGDKAMASEMLAAQAVVLDTMFTELAHRAANNLGQYIDTADRYARLALKAQANCRATLEALAKLHQPREQTVKHVHVNEGGQAIVAEQFHQHTGGKENGNSNGQSHATGPAGESPALLGADSEGNGVPIPGGDGPQALPDARRNKSRRT